jgi:RNA polymerase sigma factor (sigma-70 family)
VWTRRKSAAPTVTLETKLVALRAMVGAARTRAEAAFVAEAMPFLRTICRWYNGPDLATEDLEAEALLALYEAMGTWTPGGRPFDTYARWGVRMALAKMLRASRMIRGRGRTGRVVVGAVLHGLDNDRLGANVGPELAMALTDTACSEAGMAERRGDAEREAECAALAEAVAALSDADQAVVAAWQAGKVRALPRGLRDRLRDAVG